MGKTYIVANWKANKTDEEARAWIEQLGNDLFENKITENKEIIVCPPFTVLTTIRGYVVTNNLPLQLGTQDISRFDKGAYTGEVPFSILNSDIKYCIIGHSERRQNFGEDDEILKTKTDNAKKGGVMPIFCVQNENTFIPEGIKIVAYEPVEAIGTGSPDTPENANLVAGFIKEKNSGVEFVLYGGSVKGDNVRSFTEKENIDGVLVGGASLDASSFLSIIDKC